jgi:hypothetical protein
MSEIEFNLSISLGLPNMLTIYINLFRKSYYSSKITVNVNLLVVSKVDQIYSKDTFWFSKDYLVRIYLRLPER